MEYSIPISFIITFAALTYIIHTCFYCKCKLVAPQHDARYSSLKVGFTTFCIVIAQARTDAQPFYLFVTKQYE